MKLKLNLSPSATTAQRLSPRRNAGVAETNLDLPAARIGGVQPATPVELTTRATKPLRIPLAVITSHPVLRGEKSYLRALRAAEEAAWNSNTKIELAGVLLP